MKKNDSSLRSYSKEIRVVGPPPPPITIPMGFPSIPAPDPPAGGRGGHPSPLPRAPSIHQALRQGLKCCEEGAHPLPPEARNSSYIEPWMTVSFHRDRKIYQMEPNDFTNTLLRSFWQGKVQRNPRGIPGRIGWCHASEVQSGTPNRAFSNCKPPAQI